MGVYIHQNYYRKSIYILLDLVESMRALTKHTYKSHN